MFRRLFNPDNELMRIMTWITDCIFLSLFWLLACIPVVTIGAATAALYDAAYYAYRRQEKNSWQRFGRSLLRNLKSSLVPSVLALAILLLAAKGLIHVWNGAVASGQWIGFAAAAFAGLVLLGILSIIFPLLSRFENSFGQLLSNSVRLGLGNLPRTIGLGIVAALMIWLCLWFVVPIFLLPCLAAVVSSIFIEPMLRPYLPEDFFAEEGEEEQPQEEEEPE